MSSPAIEFARKNYPRFMEELKALLRIPSISTLPENDADCRKTAETLAAELKRIGLENSQLMETVGHPLVYADWLHAPGKPTVLLYGHYDVQPVDPIDEWLTPPFEPTGECTRAAGRRRRGGRRRHCGLCGLEARQPEVRLCAHLRHGAVRSRTADPVRGPARDDLHRNRGARTQERSALRHVRRRGSQSLCLAGADSGQAEGRGRPHRDSRLLRRHHSA